MLKPTQPDPRVLHNRLPIERVHKMKSELESRKSEVQIF
jgi:hypothetical protein